jgi:DNA polymerase-3 subunit beta
MKITIDRSELLKKLGHVQSVVERRNTIPILSNVLLDATGTKLVMLATDLDIQISDSAEAVIEVPGTTTVSAQMLFDIVKKLPDGSQVRLELDQAKLKVVAGRSRFQIPTIPSDDFPKMSKGNMEHEFAVTTGSLQKAFERTRFAMSTEESRYYLNGIYIHVSEGKLLAVATDGHRLAKNTVETGDAALAGMPDVIIPRKTVGELIKLLSEYEGEIEVGVSKGKVSFDIGDLHLLSKTVDGTFPDYTRVIPQNNGIVVKVNVAPLDEAVDRVTVVSSEKTRAVKMEVSGDTIKVSVTSIETGNANDEVLCEANGEIEIGFNSKYLSEMLKYIESDVVEFRFDAAASPVLVIDQTRPDDVGVLMPMRV